MILDYGQDINGQELARMLQLYNLPQLNSIKQASLDDSQAPPRAFADPGNRLYNCYTKQATLISALYFIEKRGYLRPQVAQRVQEHLDEYINYWGLENDVQALEKRHDELEKNSVDSLADSDFALIVKDEAGNKERHYPLRNPAEIKRAADYLQQHRNDIPWKDRQVMAYRILDAAENKAADLGSMANYLHKQAGMGVGNPQDIILGIRGRAAAAQGDMKELLTKLAKAAAERPQDVLNRDRLPQLMNTLEGVDRDLGLVSSYGNGWQAPEDLLFGATFKSAREELNDQCRLTSGSTYKLSELSRLDIRDLQGCLGDEITRELRQGFNLDPVKVAEVLPTLPRDDAELLDRLCFEKGISPIFKQAEDVQQMGQAEWDQLATGYQRSPAPRKAVSLF